MTKISYDAIIKNFKKLKIDIFIYYDFILSIIYKRIEGFNGVITSKNNFQWSSSIYFLRYYHRNFTLIITTLVISIFICYSAFLKTKAQILVWWASNSYAIYTLINMQHSLHALEYQLFFFFSFVSNLLNILVCFF